MISDRADIRDAVGDLAASHAESGHCGKLRDVTNPLPTLATSNTLTATEALFIAAGCRTVNLDSLSILVVVAEYTPDMAENVWLSEGDVPPGPDAVWPFELGEILLVRTTREDMTEFCGKGRDLEYWNKFADRCTSHRGDLGTAWALSQQVKAGMPAGIYEFMDGRWQRPSDQDYAYDSWCSDPDSWLVNVGNFRP